MRATSILPLKCRQILAKAHRCGAGCISAYKARFRSPRGQAETQPVPHRCALHWVDLAYISGNTASEKGNQSRRYIQPSRMIRQLLRLTLNPSLAACGGVIGGLFAGSRPTEARGARVRGRAGADPIARLDTASGLGRPRRTH